MPGNELRPDIAAAKEKMRVRLGAGREIKRLTAHLWEGEIVERMTAGTYGVGQGLVVLTDRRLLFTKDGMMSQKTEDFPIAKISSVQWSSGMIQGSIIIFTSGNKAEIKNVAKADGKEIVDLIRGCLSATPQSSPPVAAQPSVADRLLKLGQLRDAGVLSDEEFAAMKSESIDRL